MSLIYRNIIVISRYFTWMLIILCNTATAQQFNIETYTTKNGLVNNNVRNLVVDSLGYLWIATWDGISRYDGYSFKNYYHHPNDSLSLSYFSIYNLMVDGGNNLWLITDQRNVAIYDRDNDIFRGIRNSYHNMPEIYSSISIDESVFLWLIKADSIFKFDFSIKEFLRYGFTDLSGSPMKIESGGAYTISASGNMIWLVFDRVYELEKSSDNTLILENLYAMIQGQISSDL